MRFQLIFCKKKSIKVIKTFKRVDDARAAYSEMIEKNISEIFFPKVYRVNKYERKASPFIRYIAVRKVLDGGSMSVCHIQSWLVEEDFLSYGTGRRFQFLQYIKDILVPIIKPLISVHVSANKIFFVKDGVVIDVLLCKNRNEAVRFFRTLRTFFVENDLFKFLAFRGIIKDIKLKSQFYDQACELFNLKRSQLKRAKTRN